MQQFSFYMYVYMYVFNIFIAILSTWYERNYMFTKILALDLIWFNKINNLAFHFKVRSFLISFREKLNLPDDKNNQ